MRMTWGTNTIDFFYDASGLPYAMKYNGTVYYYVTNLQGDVMRIVDASQNIVTSYDYDPYGKVISATGTLANINPLRYRGYVYDQETGFYYLQSRYYDPAIGRFINADSYASTGQGIIGHNMFTYCSNNPMVYSDFTGHSLLSSLVFPVATYLLETWLLGDGSHQMYGEESVVANALKKSKTMRNKIYEEVEKFESGAEYGTGSIQFRPIEPDLWLGIRRASYQLTISQNTSHYKKGFYEGNVVFYEVKVKLWDTYDFNIGNEKGDGIGSLLNNFGYWLQENNKGTEYTWEVNFTYEILLYVQI